MPRKKAAEQPLINLGMIGHVDHGKTTLLERLSGKWADTHSEELKRGITIRLGYADVTFYKTKDGDFTTEAKDSKGTKNEEVRMVSFVDAPGHESLMATMLAGTTIMDGALLLIAANEECPQPQTKEHIMALQIMGIEKVIVVQNKIDLTEEDKAIANYKAIKDFLKDTPYKDAPIIPISAQHNVGISNLIKTIEEVMTTPKRDEKKDAAMLIARSFDINKPGTKVDKLVGGVLGGSLQHGIFKEGDEVEIRPGYQTIERNQQIWHPIKTKIVGIKSGGQNLDEVHPGGSIAVLTSLDPSVVSSDKLTGNVVAHPGKVPPVWNDIKLKVTLLDRVVGSKDDLNVQPIKKAENLMLNVNSAATIGQVYDLSKGLVSAKLRLPVCAEVGSRVTISRMVGNRFRLIGYGTIEE